MASLCSVIKPPAVVSSAFGEQQLYDFNMPTICSASKSPVRVSAFVKASQYQRFVSGGSGTKTIDTNVFFIFQTFKSSSITLIPGA